MIHTVFFDLDDTLFDHAYCARSALAQVRTMHEALASADAAAFEQAHARILEELHLEVMTGRVNIDVARVERFRRLCETLGASVPATFPEMAAAAYRQHYIESRREVAGASALLAAVKQSANVGIISNNLLAEQQEKLRHCGLDGYIDVLVVSEEAGAAKPDPAIFAVALERAGCAAADAVMVGDSWANDIEGARRAGMRAVWVNPEGRPAPDPQVPVIRGLEPTHHVLDVLLARTEKR